MKPKIPLLKPHITGEELNFIQESFAQNWITTSGHNLTSFESELEQFVGGSEKVLCLNSGTSAIHLALILLGIEKGDKVICQSFTFCASANPIKYLGAEPVFVDSDEHTWNMSPYYLKLAIEDLNKKNELPKAIIVTNSYGMPAKWKEILEIVKPYNIPVIEDAAESLGSEYHGQKCVTLGNLGIFSFNGNKIITTSAGGALITTSEEQQKKTLHLALQAKEFPNSFKHDYIGYNYRMSNVLAGIGRGQLKVLDTRVEQKRELNAFYARMTSEIAEFSIKQEPSQEFRSNYWLNCIVGQGQSDERIKRLQQLFEKENVEHREFWYPLHMQGIYKGTTYYGNNTCLKIYNSGFVLPSSTNMSKDEKERIQGVFYSYTKYLWRICKLELEPYCPPKRIAKRYGKVNKNIVLSQQNNKNLA